MQVVENMEKHILRSLFTRQLMNIVYQQQVDALVKMDKVVDAVVEISLRILHLKQMRGNIKNSQLGIFIERVIAYSMQKMGFPHAGLTINK